MEASTGVGPFVGQPPATATSAGRRRTLPDLADWLADWPHTSRILPWALFGFVAMIWVIPFDSIILPVGTPVDASLDRVFLVALAGIWLFSESSKPRDRSVRFSPIHWAFAVFILVALVSVLLRDVKLVRVGGLDLSVKQLARLASYGLFFALAASIIRPSELSKMTKAMLGFACFTALAVIVEYRFGINVFHDWIGPLFPGYVRPEGIGTYDAIGRKLIYGPSVQPLAVAVMFSLALPFAFAWLLEAKERRERILYGAAVLILIGGAVATQKKTSMVGPLICILVLCAYRPRPMARLAPWLIVLVVVVHAFAPGALGAVVDQFAPGTVTKVNTTKDRANDYDAVKPDVAGHLLIGRGYGSYDQKQHRILDNQYLSLAIEVGLIGLLAYLAIFVAAFFSAHPVARSGDPDRAPPALAAATAIVVALVAGAILDFLSFPQLAYLLCFIAAIAYVSCRDWAQHRKVHQS
ncbi:MAG TPA: O-antigen ligase family protein [Solirubrobacterales bacterium]|nr:O-antigen ligase family protein [Solirubrobacterales bacterium]